jgi:P27 family predicted phage terminase small subunit
MPFCARPPTPTRLKLIRGNPGRRRLRPEPEPLRLSECPEPPAHVAGFGAEEWRRIAPELHRLGLLTLLDTRAFEAYCVSYGRWRQAEQALVDAELIVPGSSQNQVANPLLKIATQAARDLIRFGAEFGLTPSARARVAAGRVLPEDSKFGDLLA